jgi:hypothetical protein
MRGLEERVISVQETQREERVTFVYENGTQKTMKYHDAILEVLNNCFCQPKITKSDQPPGSFIWAVISGQKENHVDLWNAADFLPQNTETVE